MIPKKPKIKKEYFAAASTSDMKDRLQKFITDGDKSSKKSKIKKTSLLIQVLPELHVAVKMAAAAEGRSVRELVTGVLVDYLKTEHDIHF